MKHSSSHYDRASEAGSSAEKREQEASYDSEHSEHKESTSKQANELPASVLFKEEDTENDEGYNVVKMNMFSEKYDSSSELLEEDVIEEDLSQVVDSKRSKTAEELEEYIADIAETVKIGLEQSISILTPWFFKNMPDIYYQTTPRAEKIRHLSAVITGHIFETKQTVELWDRNRSKVTYIGPGGQSQILSAMAGKIASLNLKMGYIYFSKDKLLFLSTFYTANDIPLDLANRHISLKLSLTRKILHEAYPENTESIERFLMHLDNDFVTCSTELRIRLTYKMVRHMEEKEGAHTFFEPREAMPKRGRLTLGIKDVAIGDVYQAVLALIQRHFKILRNFNVRLSKGFEQSIVVMHFEIAHREGKTIELKGLEMVSLTKALRTLGWVDSDDYTKFMQEPFFFSINAANLLRAMAIWTHVQLSKENAYYYSEYKIFHTLVTYEEITKGLVELFRMRFDHHYHQRHEEQSQAVEEYERMQKQVEDLIHLLMDHVCQDIFRACVSFLRYTLKTNYFLPTKTGLAFRLDPQILKSAYYPNLPFGIFYIIGRDYRCFQVRWKDISRGGMRLIMPQSTSGYCHALSTLFDEVFDLSYAQQMKNKDIPEGGSKAAVLVKPRGNKHRAVRGAVNALLDLLVESDESFEEKSSELIKYYTQDEIIYLGPDENMTNDLIQWITHQAARRGYPHARAFMSSKPGDGINHKEYGVTSEGVNVFLEYSLRYLAIDPRKDTFSVKLTGGPSGDVAGNALKILHREYAANARVVVVADGSGVACDPDGLDWPELLRLCEEGLDIIHFSKDKLSSQDAYVMDALSLDNIRKRDASYMSVYADVFMPAGGRPYSITEKNWNRFISSSGPSCKVIVEGANIFFTAEARKHLQDAGVLMIKDSSANKAGVICSSFEALASLIFSAEEFRFLREVYIQQVIAKLKEKASEEAQLLFFEYEKREGKAHLSDLSLKISEAINSIKDMLLEELNAHSEKYLSDASIQDMLKQYMPAVVVEKYPDRIQRLPVSHQIAIIATFIASRVVYREGVDWMYTIPESARLHACLSYLKNEKQKSTLIDAVNKSDIKNKQQIMAILHNYAARQLTLFDLQESKQGGKKLEAVNKDISEKTS